MTISDNNDGNSIGYLGIHVSYFYPTYTMKCKT